MFSFRDLIIFLAGAEFFHTISHIFLAYWFHFPIHFHTFVFTHHLNTLAIMGNGIITLLLLWWGLRLNKRKRKFN